MLHIILVIVIMAIMTIIISRSIVPSLVLAIFNVKNTLEIHTELTGITRFIFIITRLDYIKRNIYH